MEMLVSCRHEFPQWRPTDLAKAIPELDSNGIDLLKVRSKATRLLGH